jgi:hypothetical protein
MGLDEYKIDYSTGLITLSTKDLSYWSNVGTGGPRHLVVRYRYQTNRPTDNVKVTYSTNEVIALNLGVVEFTRKNRETLPFETSERVVVKNMKR